MSQVLPISILAHECVTASLLWFITPTLFFCFLDVRYQWPSHTKHNLVPTPVCRLCHWIQTSGTEPGSSWCRQSFFPALSSAPCALCLVCKGGDGRMAKSYIEGDFCLSVLPSRDVHHPVLAFVSPLAAMSTHAFIQKCLRLCTGKHAAHQPSRPCIEWISFLTQGRSLIIHFLSSESMLVSGWGVQRNTMLR